MNSRSVVRGLIHLGAIAGVGVLLSGSSVAQSTSATGGGPRVGAPQTVIVGLAVLCLLFLASALRSALQSESTEQSYAPPEGYDGPQLSQQSPKQNGLPTDRSFRPDDNDDATSRRTFLVAAGGLAVLIGVGVVFARQRGVAPDDAAERFIRQVDGGDFGRADELIHPGSPLDGAGDALDLIVAFAGVDAVIDAVDISVVESRVLHQNDNTATVEVTLSIDLLLEDVETDVPLDMRTADGEWHVWNVDL